MRGGGLQLQTAYKALSPQTTRRAHNATPPYTQIARGAYPSTHTHKLVLGVGDSNKEAQFTSYARLAFDAVLGGVDVEIVSWDAASRSSAFDTAAKKLRACGHQSSRLTRRCLVTDGSILDKSAMTLKASKQELPPGTVRPAPTGEASREECDNAEEEDLPAATPYPRTALTSGMEKEARLYASLKISLAATLAAKGALCPGAASARTEDGRYYAVPLAAFFEAWRGCMGQPFGESFPAPTDAERLCEMLKRVNRPGLLVTAPTKLSTAPLLRIPLRWVPPAAAAAIAAATAAAALARAPFAEAAGGGGRAGAAPAAAAGGGGGSSAPGWGGRGDRGGGGGGGGGWDAAF